MPRILNRAPVFWFLNILIFLLFFIIIFSSLIIPVKIIKISMHFNIFLFFLSIIASFLIFIYSYILLIALICYPMRKALKPGIYNINSAQAKLWPVLANIAALLLRPPFYSLISHFSIFSIPAFKLLGLKTDGIVLIGSCSISDPWFTEIGNNTIIADNSSLLGHLLEGNKLILGKIKVGNHSVIGFGSTILPRVEIGNETIIGAHSLVLKNVKIPNKEIWAGIPAKKLRKIL